ncbi:hypothetical protein LOC67_14350 [Stieleria sp. JC731]|uniref:hypothetical protein n=1 Tax=Pirellulaceae TaxID=2691357 RepID=UPI001E5E8837|nr:hypothetical protein [Stieleria sp. JC731]MCC9601737.1 hypothetical protein [Stieleria sp. JC731]
MSLSKPNHFLQTAAQDKFFVELEEQLFKRLKIEATSDQSHELLKHHAGLKDEVLLSELSNLGITPESLIVMRLLPLVLVAWAERGVDSKEHAAVLDIARQFGIDDWSVAFVLLDHWLQHRPPAECYDAWCRYMKEVTKQMSPASRASLIDILEQQMTAVAKASGGYIGLGKVSKQERQTIERLIAVLRHQMPGDRAETH